MAKHREDATQQNTKGVELGNRYDALSQKENQDEGFTVLLMDAINPPSQTKLKKEKKVLLRVSTKGQSRFVVVERKE